jgi:hypothetical protein
MKSNFIIQVFLSIIFANIVEAQELHSVNQKFGFHDGCYNVRMKSIKLYRSGSPLTDPVIKLNTGETVTLMFDEILQFGESPANYYYTIEHRNADWFDENLLQSDYMTGFPENKLESVGSSMNTGVTFVAYSLILPNPDVSLKISGNYLIRVYDSESRELMFEKGFSLVEALADVYASVKPPVAQTCMQQIDLKVAHQKVRVGDPYANLKIRIEQNSVRIPDISVPVPAFSQPNLTDFSRPDRNMYPGLNEFRAFDIRNLSFNGQGVAAIRSTQGTYNVTLVKDLPTSRYVAFNDANGKYLVGSDRAQNPATQSDYAEVNFSFSPTESMIGRIFVFGELTNYALQDENEMLYSPETDTYSCTLLLKQGYYNYRYVLLTYEGKLEIIPSEGCFYDTENAYNVYVYFNSPDTRYDRLIGFEKISSRNR